VLSRAGAHVIEFSYRPPRWWPSMAAAAAGGAMLIALTVRRRD